MKTDNIVDFISNKKKVAPVAAYRNVKKKTASITEFDPNRKKSVPVVKLPSVGMGLVTSVMKLHLELNTDWLDEEDWRLLRKHGSVEKTISRDILAPADITLHALHFAIQRLFGWQNSHLHNFSLPDEVFRSLTENRFLIWTMLAGVYFRFPSEDFKDLYWDDDYKPGQGIKPWMKKKYTGPYEYNGRREHYLYNQMEAWEMLTRWDEITVRNLDPQAEEQPEPYNVKLSDATMDETLNVFMDMVCYELLERLPLSQVMSLHPTEEQKLSELKENLAAGWNLANTEAAIQKWTAEHSFEFEKEELEFLHAHDIPALPVTDRLCYSYDYGDGWEVQISCENIYTKDSKANWTDKDGKRVGEATDLARRLVETSAKIRPVCIAKDGIELVDDIGGLRGFCDMLRTVYECDMDSDEALDERDDMLDWLHGMGWRGNLISPRMTL